MWMWLKMGSFIRTFWWILPSEKPSNMRMWECEDEKMWRCKDVQVRRCEDKKMWRCEDEKVWRFQDVMWRCEDVKKFDRPPLLEEPFAQTLSGKTTKNRQCRRPRPNGRLLNQLAHHGCALAHANNHLRDASLGRGSFIMTWVCPKIRHPGILSTVSQITSS